MSDEAQSQNDVFRQTLERVESFTSDEMREWVTSVLRGRDTLLPARPENSRASAVESIYGHLTRIPREFLLEATRSLLYDFVAGRDWTGEAADDLLLLAQYLDPREAGHILDSLASRPDFESLDEALQYRVLQSLVALGVRRPWAFWCGVLRRDPQRYAGLAFDGIARTSPHDAIRLLPLLPDGENVAELIGNALPGFLDEAGADALPGICDLVSRKLRELAPAVRAEIEECFEEQGMPLTPPTATSRLSDGLPLRSVVDLPALDLEDVESVGVRVAVGI